MNSKLLNLLSSDFNYYITDPLWKDIPLNRALLKLVKTKAFQKLNRIKQNGPAYHVYPGAVHTRFNHSLGVYKLSRDILLTLLKEDDPPFTEKGVLSFLTSALLHDLGHFPYAHSLKELAIKEHEELAVEIIKNNGELLKTIEEIGADTEMVFNIINDKLECEDEETILYRKLLSGTLDPDKLDYLNRDAFFSGVPYGIQETDKVIHSLCYRDGNFLINQNAISCVEHLLFSKYLMYKNVYWHQEVRAATAMVKKAILDAIINGKIKESSLYYIDDFEFSILPQTIAFPSFSLIRAQEDGNLLTCSYEKEYEIDGKIEIGCKDVYKRHIIENKLYSILKKDYPALEYYEIVIDIPEPISFESDISVLSGDKALPFDQIDPLFNEDIKNLFSESLRKVRIFTPEYIDGEKLKKVVDNGFKYN